MGWSNKWQPFIRCHCRQCRYGLRTRSGSHMARRKQRAFRHATKIALKMGYEPPRWIELGYTD